VIIRLTIPLLTFLAGALGTRALAQEWTRFRGPNGTGLGLATNLPARWAEADLRWKATLPGAGHSSPVLWGETVFVTGADVNADKLVVAALDTTDGHLRWRRDFPVANPPLHRNNSFATATPAVDERRLFVPRDEDGDLVLTALTHANGSPAWEFNAGELVTEHGLGHSPIVHDGRVILAHDHDEAGRIVALDAATGRLLWETPRRPGRADYSVPALSEATGRDAWLIFNSQEDGICAVHPADGRVVWRSPPVLTMRSVSSPIAAAGLLFSSCGSGGGGNYVVALRPPTAPGSLPTIAYQVRKSAPYVPTPLALGELLFLWSDGGIVTCVRAASGAQLWQERVGGNYFGSPICADGKLINLSTTGEVVVLAAGEKYELLGRNALGEGGHATPAVAHGCLFIRTLGHLVCVGPAQ
jgi:outer membrane protein assembly factor BamB